MDLRYFARELCTLSELDLFAADLKASLLANGCRLVLLEGTLGSGKTAFCQALFRHCGVRAGEVLSPTFSMLHEYESEQGLFFHLDVHLKQPSFIQFRELASEGDLIVIEWGDLLLGETEWRTLFMELLRGFLLVKISVLADGSRSFEGSLKLHPIETKLRLAAQSTQPPTQKDRPQPPKP